MVFHRRHGNLCEYPIFSPYPCLYFLSLPIDQRKGFSGRQGEGNSLYTPVALLFISSH